MWSICHWYRLSSVQEVGQTVQLSLAVQLDRLRGPAALRGWLATTTARECLRMVTAAGKSERAGTGLDDLLQVIDDTAIDEEIRMAELNAGLRAALAELPPRCQQLLAMLVTDPPRPYAEIAQKLGVPVGSVGPLRARCLERLRRSSAFIVRRDEQERLRLAQHRRHLANLPLSRRGGNATRGR